LAGELEIAQATGQAVVKITCPSADVADRLAHALVEARAAACVNIVAGVTSVYRWQGEICRDHEVLLLVKTSMARSEQLLRLVQEHHPYEVPEVIWTAVVQGSRGYLEWMLECLAREG
jgi:periplasmic divalent cation tolerance protein